MLVALLLQPWRYGDGDVFVGGNDPVWQQAMFQVHGQAGIFGASDHLAFPSAPTRGGSRRWARLIGAWAWVTVGWFGMATAASVLWYLVVIAGHNAAAIVYFLRGIVGPRAAACWCSPCSFRRPPPPMAWPTSSTSPPVPRRLGAGVLVRLPTMPRPRRRATLAALAVVAMVAPAVVDRRRCPFLLPVMAIPLAGPTGVGPARELAMVWGVLVLGLALQTVVFVVARSQGPGADETRAAWTSNASFGHLSDLFVGSPLIGSLFPGTVAELEPGSSLTHAFGLPMLVTAAVALVVLVAVPPRRSAPVTDTSVLAAATIGTTLFWLGGGLGNLQAALAVPAGTVSPARTWLRMLAVLAILGAGGWWPSRAWTGRGRLGAAGRPRGRPCGGCGRPWPPASCWSASSPTSSPTTSPASTDRPGPRRARGRRRLPRPRWTRARWRSCRTSRTRTRGSRRGSPAT